MRNAASAESTNPASSIPERREYRMLGEKQLAGIARGTGRLSLVSTDTAWTTGSSVALLAMQRRLTGLDVAGLVEGVADFGTLVEAAARFPRRRGHLLRRWLADR